MKFVKFLCVFCNSFLTYVIILTSYTILLIFDFKQDENDNNPTFNQTHKGYVEENSGMGTIHTHIYFLF